MKLALGIQYDGSNYHGWQTQPEVKTVQKCLEKALKKIADHPVRIHCAGRTDTGVHGIGQVVHFETNANRDDSSWLFGTNANLPSDISVQWVKKVDEEFHARFSAERRVYQYYILNQPARPALLNNKVVWEPRSLSLDHMQKAAKCLIGTHDFSAYRSLTCQANSPVRTIYMLDLKKQGSIIKLNIEANAFLHHMVRNISGVLMKIGMERADPDWAKEVLDGRDRTLGGVTAPPEGLYLMKVYYPEHFNIPSPDIINIGF
ncbi:MAG: tRNA pseudouridine(38-40) synthase TruA [Gammaproteobacteria bacterium]